MGDDGSRGLPAGSSLGAGPLNAATGPGALGLGDRPDPRLEGQGGRVLQELVLLWLSTLLLIRLVVELQRGLGLPSWLLAIVPLAFIYAPVWLCHRRGVDSWAYRLSIPAFSDLRSWGAGARLAGKGVLLLILPWLPLYHLWQTRLFGLAPGAGWANGAAAALARIGEPPPNLVLQGLAELVGRGPALETALAAVQVLTLVAYQLFFVAIPEEFFYRGYMQTRLNEWLPRRFLVFGTPMGWGAVIATAFFAFGHSLVLFQWWHFATFFPGLVFAWMRERDGGVLPGALFHAACNIAVVLLDNAYGVPRAAF